MYVGIRGWLEYWDDQLPAIREIIEAHREDSYTANWVVPPGHSWGQYVVYAGDIRTAYTSWFLDQLRAIAAVTTGDEPVTGLFFAHHEDRGRLEWHVRDGQVIELPGDERYRYLDD